MKRMGRGAGTGGRPTAALLTHADLTTWRQRAAVDPVAGLLGPYGFEHLDGHGFDTAWADLSTGRLAASRVVRKLRSIVESDVTRRGAFKALASSGVVRRSDVVVSMFEDQGTAAAELRRLRVYPFSKVPQVLVLCWMAETLRTLATQQRRDLARTLSRVEALVVFSANQVDMLSEQLGISRDRIHVVPFGVSTDFFSLDPEAPEPDLDVVAVGQDSSRDYQTLFRAVERLDIRVVVICAPRNIEGLRIPGNVNVVSGASHVEYRNHLARARVVVTPTFAPAYPAGQTVLLEAMSMKRPNVITDSPAIRDYVNGETAVLVPPGDPEALGFTVQDLLANPARRQALGTAARDTAVTLFDHRNMWTAMADVIEQVC